MSEFKVGDRVKHNDYGIGKIIACDSWKTKGNEDCFAYFVRFDDGDETWVSKENLKLIKRAKTKEQQKIEELEKRIEKLEKEVFKPLTIKDGIKKSLEENLKISLKPSLLTEDERVILRNLDKKWKWIGRDEVDCLRIFKDKPYREKGYWRSLGNHEFLDIFNHLFCFIGLKDDEPYNIEELLKGESDNE